MAEILVLVEHRNGTVSRPTLEALTAARAVGEPVAVVLGAAAEECVSRLGEYGAAEVLLCTDPAVTEVVVAGVVDVLSTVVRERTPAAVLVVASAEGKEIAGRLAVRLGSGVLTDAVGISVDDTGVRVRQAIFGGSTVVTSRVRRGVPVVSWRPNAVRAEAAPGTPRVTSIAAPPGADRQARVTATRVAAGGGRPALNEASVVVAGGRGVGSAENFALIEELADVLGGAVGASRAATDAGWLPHTAQVGQTGATVSPDLYIACGISGAIQHVAGMQTAKTIVAINKDPEAPIFQIADFGIVGDLHRVVPALIREIRRRREGG